MRCVDVIITVMIPKIKKNSKKYTFDDIMKKTLLNLFRNI